MIGKTPGQIVAGQRTVPLSALGQRTVPLSALSASLIRMTIVLMLLVALVPGAGYGCSQEANAPSDDPMRIATLADIPGVTEEEVDAIEKLRGEHDRFIFGVNPGTEAFIADDGGIRGFSALFCEWLTGVFEIPFIPAVYEWGELIDGLADRSISFTGDLTPNEERRKTYHMTDAIAVRSIKTFRIKDSESLTDLAEQRTLRFAFLTGTTTYGEVTPHLGYEYEVEYVDDYEVVYRLLSSGEVDAFFDDGPAEAVFLAYPDVAAADFFPLIYNPVSLSTQDAGLMPVIAVVQKALDGGAIQYLNALYNQGYVEYKQHRLSLRFTPQERAYLREHGVIPFAAEFDNYPKSFYNVNEREWQGICFDVLAEVGVLTGLEFEVANDQDAGFVALLEMLDHGEAFFVSELIRSQERKGRYLWPEAALLTDQSALLSKSDYHNINVNEMLAVKVGLQRGTAHSELFMKWFPEHKNTVEYDSTNEALEALTRGDVDMVMESTGTLLHLTHYQELVGYKANIVFENSYESTFGFNSDQALLCSIIDKTIEEIDVDTISGQWLLKTFDYRIKLAEAQRPWIIGAMVLVVMILALITVMFYRMRKSDRLVMETRIREQALSAENKMLDTLNHMKNEFFQNMSHDLKTPLTVISTDIYNATDYLDFEMDKNDMRASLEHAQSEVMRMAHMVDGALRYSAMHDSQKDAEAIDIAAFLREGSENYRAVIERNGNRLVLDIPEALPSVSGSADTLLHVLSNLLTNANHHTRDGEVSVRALVDGNAVLVTVQDTGTGIRPELLPHIFERGVSDGGTGLGLSICKSAIEDMGGEILATSEYGRGTAIMFKLSVVDKGERHEQ